MIRASSKLWPDQEPTHVQYPVHEGAHTPWGGTYLACKQCRADWELTSMIWWNNSSTSATVLDWQWWRCWSFGMTSMTVLTAWRACKISTTGTDRFRGSARNGSADKTRSARSSFCLLFSLNRLRMTSVRLPSDTRTASMICGFWHNHLVQEYWIVGIEGVPLRVHCLYIWSDPS